MEVLKRLFERHFQLPVERVEPLQGQLGGSGRKIIRLSSDKLSAIGILYDVRGENVAFLEFSRHFRRHGLPVPEIYAEDLTNAVSRVSSTSVRKRTMARAPTRVRDRAGLLPICRGNAR